MAFLSFDYPLTGAGQADFGEVLGVIYMAVHIETQGPLVHEVDTPSGYLYRVGWVSLGDQFDYGDGTVRWYWNEPERITFPDWRWSPFPSSVFAGGTNILAAHGVRWFVTEGTVGNLHVFGED